MNLYVAITTQFSLLRSANPKYIEDFKKNHHSALVETLKKTNFIELHNKIVRKWINKSKLDAVDCTTFFRKTDKQYSLRISNLDCIYTWKHPKLDLKTFLESSSCIIILPIKQRYNQNI